MERKSLSRRSVLSTGWRALAAAPLLSLPKESAASVLGNRSLVCLYLLGGSDGNGMFAPLDPKQFDAYAAARGELAMPRHAFLPAEARDSAMQVGFHPALPELRNFFLDGSLALAANIGPERRVSPVSGSVQPVHPDRRYENLAFVAGGYATLKWAASQAGVTSVATDRVLTFSGGVTMLPLGDASFTGSRTAEFRRSAQSLSARMTFPNTAIGRQLRTVAGLLQSETAMGGAQVYFVPVAGLNPAAQANQVAGKRYRQFSQAIGAFRQAIVSAGLDRRVVTFTDSEFGRTLAPNAARGSNAGWGNHQFVLGGGVKGGRIYGQFPDMTGAHDTDSALIPTTSPAQFHGALASWVGVSGGEMASLFPSLGASSAGHMGFAA